MPALLTDFVASGYPMGWLTFARQQVAINQAQVQLNIIETRATTGTLNVTGVVMPLPGSIVALSLNLTANKTAGAESVSPTIGGTEVASTNPLYRVAIANAAATAYKQVDALTPGLIFKAGDILGVKLTSDGSLAPTTNDIYVVMWYVFHQVEF